MKKKAIKIECKGADLLPINEMVHFQGELKEISEENLHKLKEEIINYGFNSPIHIWKSKKKKYITDGHQRLIALKALDEDGYKIPEKIPVDYIHAKSFKDAKHILLSRVSQYGKVNARGLYDYLEDSQIHISEAIQSFQIPEIDMEQFQVKFFVDPEKEKQNELEDEVPDKAKSRCKSGDIWILGDHRLLCGDATSVDDVDSLIGGKKTDMVFTDPPYGMNLQCDYSKWPTKGGQAKKGTIGNEFKPVIGDDKEFDPSFILNFFNEIKEIFMWGGEYHYQNLPKGGVFIVWDKNNGNESADKMIGSGYELCWSKQKHKREMCRMFGRGTFGHDKVKIHPTQKPVQLAEWFFEKWGKNKTNIIDLYGGSGSTLIACEKTSKKCFMMEISPEYCDVILQRWADYTGKEPILDKKSRK